MKEFFIKADKYLERNIDFLVDESLIEDDYNDFVRYVINNMYYLIGFTDSDELVCDFDDFSDNNIFLDNYLIKSERFENPEEDIIKIALDEDIFKSEDLDYIRFCLDNSYDFHFEDSQETISFLIALYQTYMSSVSLRKLFYQTLDEAKLNEEETYLEGYEQLCEKLDSLGLLYTCDKECESQADQEYDYIVEDFLGTTITADLFVMLDILDNFEKLEILSGEKLIDKSLVLDLIEHIENLRFYEDSDLNDFKCNCHHCDCHRLEDLDLDYLFEDLDEDDLYEDDEEDDEDECPKTTPFDAEESDFEKMLKSIYNPDENGPKGLLQMTEEERREKERQEELEKWSKLFIDENEIINEEKDMLKRTHSQDYFSLGQLFAKNNKTEDSILKFVEENFEQILEDYIFVKNFYFEDEDGQCDLTMLDILSILILELIVKKHPELFDLL